MPERRERLVFWALAAALLVATALAYVVLVGPEPGSGRGGAPARVAQVPVEPAPVPLAIGAVSGEVTIFRRGVAEPARTGDDVRAGDAIATAPGSRVEIAGGPYAFAVEEASRAALREAADGRARVRVESGLVAATARGGARVEIDADDAMARGGAGTLWLSRAGRVVAAAVRGGTAELRSGAIAGAVALGDGQIAIAVDGGPPSSAAPLPAALPLEVAWPPPRTNRSRVMVTGTTAPGARVFVADEPAEVAPDGTFAREVVLHEGRQRLEARADVVGGVRAAREGGVTLDTHGPKPKFDTRRLWRTR